MKTCALLPLMAMLAACATTAPPELRNPTAHIRPVERGDVAATQSSRTADVTKSDAPGCEDERRAALFGNVGERVAFTECLLDTGGFLRAASMVAAYLPEREDLRLRAELREQLRDEVEPVAVQVLQDHEPEPVADEATLNALILVSPDDAWAWAALGREYERQGRDAEANDAFLKAKAVEGRSRS